MNGRAAKILRRAVYGDRVTSPKGRSYRRQRNSGSIYGDERRTTYRRLKRAFDLANADQRRIMLSAWSKMNKDST